MIPKINMLIIGAGGVASYLIPILYRVFKGSTFLIFDGDKLEERNLDRQAFDAGEIGHNKAAAIIQTLLIRAELETENADQVSSEELVAFDKFYTGSHDIPEEYRPYLRLIICVADNHEARKFALLSADELQIPCIIGANEYFDSEAYIYQPAWKDTPMDPRIKSPEILTSLTGSPLHCQEEQEASPQLAIANFACAGKIATMVWRWLVDTKKNKIHLHHENIYETITATPVEPTPAVAP